MVERLLINTSLGRSVLGLEDKVLSSIDGEFLEKPAVDLNVGESVLYEKRYIAMVLEEVEPYLLMSDRYANAKNMMHETNNRGGYVPILRTKLIRGFANRGEIQEENLEEKILLQGEDLSRESYRVMIESIGELLGTRNMGVSDSAINKWLKGETLSPREWAIYGILAQINPEFIDFQQLNRGREGHFFNYKLYTTIRQGIMRYLANPIHSPPQLEHEPEDTLDLSLAQEIQLVFDNLVGDIDTEYAVAQVLEIEGLYKKHSLVRRSREEPRLRKGIVTGRVPQFESRKKDISEIVMGKKILEGTFYKIINNQFGERIKEYLENIDLSKVGTDFDDVDLDKNDPIYGYLKNIFDVVVKREILEEQRRSVDFAKKMGYELLASRIIDGHVSVRGEPKFKNLFTFMLSGPVRVDLTDLCNEFSDEMYTGRIDEKLDAPFGTTLRVLNLLKRYYRSVPRSILEHIECTEKEITYLTQKKASEIQGTFLNQSVLFDLEEATQRGKQLERRIKKRYPFFENRPVEIGLTRDDEYTIEQKNEFLDKNNLAALKGLKMKNEPLG